MPDADATSRTRGGGANVGQLLTRQADRFLDERMGAAFEHPNDRGGMGARRQQNMHDVGPLALEHRIEVGIHVLDGERLRRDLGTAVAQVAHRRDPRFRNGAETFQVVLGYVPGTENADADLGDSRIHRVALTCIR